MRRPFLLLTFLLIAFGADAAPKKYKDWPQSPEAYFMTEAERNEWRSVRNDQEAKAFIARYVARRGGTTFTELVKTRTAIADRMFTLVGGKGSSTIRGKLVVLFGEPVRTSLSERMVENSRTLAMPEVASDLSNSRQPAVTARKVEAFGEKSRDTGMAGRRYRVLTLTFAAASNPAFNGEDYDVAIEVDSGNGKDVLPKKTDHKKLEALMNAAAAASIVNRGR